MDDPVDPKEEMDMMKDDESEPILQSSDELNRSN